MPQCYFVDMISCCTRYVQKMLRTVRLKTICVCVVYLRLTCFRFDGILLSFRRAIFFANFILRQIKNELHMTSPVHFALCTILNLTPFPASQFLFLQIPTFFYPYPFPSAAEREERVTETSSVMIHQ